MTEATYMNDYISENNGEELYRRFQNGDHSVLEQLIDLYKNSLMRYIYTFVNDNRDAEELMIDALTELVISKKYRGQSSLKTYLFAIGRNISLHHIRKYKRRDSVPHEDIPDDVYDHINLPEYNFVREDERQRLRAAIQTLKCEHREVLHLVYYERMSYADAGVSMKKSVTQINNLLHKAKTTLKIILENEGLGY